MSWTQWAALHERDYRAGLGGFGDARLRIIDMGNFRHVLLFRRAPQSVSIDYKCICTYVGALRVCQADDSCRSMLLEHPRAAGTHNESGDSCRRRSLATGGGEVRPIQAKPAA